MDANTRFFEHLLNVRILYWKDAISKLDASSTKKVPFSGISHNSPFQHCSPSSPIQLVKLQVVWLEAGLVPLAKNKMALSLHANSPSAPCAAVVLVTYREEDSLRSQSVKNTCNKLLPTGKSGVETSNTNTCFLLS